ncbi:type IV pili methyl-accepting chemotaxis transducer N-terminal domain-containing protein [Fulvivirgaceae bacterium BMA12]|uniref:histidine kinase n=1 Tax=Agaribacillus aureus TaxID=3051825 RepID=A0ABT8L890_9BACT|nr:type IV pili methyl-accepting chemotaxis transducer N-terminal domain-containing protein [Fulvivirgaceae bacterium BMA12]
MPFKIKFERLGIFYMLALSGIAASIIISQIFIQNFIDRQQNDSRIINIAGRQRMLSQKISKIVLQIREATELSTVKSHRDELQETLQLWSEAHNSLVNGDEAHPLNENNSVVITDMFQKIEPHFVAMVGNAQSIADLIDQMKQVGSKPDLNPFINNILANEGDFLAIMDDIVFQYDREAKAKVEGLKKVEMILLAISLGIILIELIFIFRPIAKNVRKTIASLIISEEASKNMTREINKLYGELEKSYQDLEAVNLEPEQPMIFLKTNDFGKITYVSENFKRLLEYEKEELPENIIQLLERDGYNPEFIKEVMNILTAGKTWNGEIKLTGKSGDFFWLDTSIVPVNNRKENKNELMVIARDMTEIKEAQLRSREINREKIEKRVKEQEYRSVLILEGQEEERKRISREIHDGIGQMLTAMKLNMEAINPSSSVHSRRRFDETKSMLKNVIKEVRRVSFNLTPSSLSDFGIAPAIKKFCNEVEKLSEINIIFDNKSGFINRLDKHIETNVYRIIQEAVNNAVKYSKAENIKVSLEHSSSQLRITIADDGKGFDVKKLKESGHFSASGHGIFNMKERTAFISGNFNLHSEPGNGTQIDLTIPLN